MTNNLLVKNNRDFTDSKYWKMGLFYYNKEDKRLFPPKRNKFLGWTINFANPFSILAFLLLIITITIVAYYLKEIN